MEELKLTTPPLITEVSLDASGNTILYSYRGHSLWTANPAYKVGGALEVVRNTRFLVEQTTSDSSMKMLEIVKEIEGASTNSFRPPETMQLKPLIPRRITSSMRRY